MTDGAIHEMSQMLGELLAGQRALDAKIDNNHVEAGRQWETVHSEIRDVKHAQHNLEQADIGHVWALRRMGEKLEPLERLPDAFAAVDKRVAAVEAVNDRVDSLDTRLGSIERLAYKLAGVAAAVAAMVTLLGPIIIHYGGEFIRWATGKH